MKVKFLHIPKTAGQELMEVGCMETMQSGGMPIPQVCLKMESVFWLVYLRLLLCLQIEHVVVV